MKTTMMVSVMVVVAVSVVAFFGIAWAEEVKLVGVITKIEVADKGGATANVTIKDNGTGNLQEIMVTDEMTLDKFKDHRIVEGDEIRCKYEVENGKNISKLFKKTAGC